MASTEIVKIKKNVHFKEARKVIIPILEDLWDDLQDMAGSDLLSRQFIIWHENVDIKLGKLVGFKADAGEWFSEKYPMYSEELDVAIAGLGVVLEDLVSNVEHEKSRLPKPVVYSEEVTAKLHKIKDKFGTEAFFNAQKRPKVPAVTITETTKGAITTVLAKVLEPLDII